MTTYISPRAGLMPTSTDLRSAATANRLKSLEGVKLGLFSNSKPNAALLVEEVALEMSAHVSLGELFRISKPLPTESASEVVYDTLAERCGAVIFAAAD